MTSRGKLLWTPGDTRQAQSALARFLAFASTYAGRGLHDYSSLHAWSVAQPGPFWQAVFAFCEVVHGGDASVPLLDPRLPGARWFPGVELNYAENLLRRSSARPAIVFASEDERLERAMSWLELRSAVARCARALEKAGVVAGDRVAAFTPNLPEAVVAYLAASAVGAIWSSCSPDFGSQGVLDRLGQITPRILFTADEYVYAGKRHSLSERALAIATSIPSIARTVVYSCAGSRPRLAPGQTAWEDFLGSEAANEQYRSFPFSQPLAILYTSGTTGVPKCLVHGAGGTLVKHLEEQVLQVDLRADDVLFYFTTCGWMMWNWLVSGLATGATVVLYDGSPLFPDPARLIRLVDRHGITVFGTSPRFLAALESSGQKPLEGHSLASLRTVLSTGAPLLPTQFEWVYRHLKRDVHLMSISGGTDIIGCFVLGSPLHPVRAGEIACRALGMDVQAFSDDGRALVHARGELVCATPFPSMPIGFWNDPDGAKYRAAYFERYSGVWHHGDYIEFFADGASVIHGRSDATLNPGGVRIGTAELYRAIQDVPGVLDFLAVGRSVGGDERVVLFVVLAPGVELDAELENTLRTRIRLETSPRHVPAEIHAISAVPRTISGKSVELAVARILRGEEVTNVSALANPEALEQFKQFAIRP